MANKKTEKVYENIVYVLFICVFSYLMKVAVSAKAFKVNGMKSMTFPKGIIAVMIILCSAKLILNIIQAVRQHNEAGESFERLHPIKLLTLAMIIVYAALWNVIGFALSSLLFITVEAKILRWKECSWLKAFLVGAGATLAVYLIFGFLFNVDFPEPIIRLLF